MRLLSKRPDQQTTCFSSAGCCPSDLRSSAGFTLLEVMLAVTIFAIVALSIQNVSSQMVRQLQALQNKTFAAWVAENRITQIRLQEEAPSIGSNTEKLVYAGRNWVMDTVISEAGRGLRRIDVTVFLDIEGNSDDPRVLSLSGFFSSQSRKGRE